MRYLLMLLVLAGCDDTTGSVDVEKQSGWPPVDPELRDRLLTPPSGPVAVVIDTDLTNEIDDEFALIYALLSPDSIDVHAVYAAPHAIWPELLETGTSELDRRILEGQLARLGLTPENIPRTNPETNMRRAHQRAVSMLQLMDRDVPAFEGAPGYLPDAVTPVESRAAEDLVERARATQGPLYVVSLGAITNVASALLMAPDIVDDIVVLWTSAYPTFWDRPNASFNLAQDLHAARVVFESGVPLVYLPGYFVGEKLRVSLPEMAEWVQGQGPVGEFLFEIYERHPLVGDHFGRSKVLWDLAPFAWLIDANWLLLEQTPTPTLDEGRFWVAQEDAPPMVEALDLWRDALFADFYAKLAAYAE